VPIAVVFFDFDPYPAVRRLDRAGAIALAVVIVAALRWPASGPGRFINDVVFVAVGIVPGPSSAGGSVPSSSTATSARRRGCSSTGGRWLELGHRWAGFITGSLCSEPAQGAGRSWLHVAAAPVLALGAGKLTMIPDRLRAGQPSVRMATAIGAGSVGLAGAALPSVPSEARGDATLPS
jgi:hypothetical protein